MLTFKEFANLPTQERLARYKELSDHDKFLARCSMDTSSHEMHFCNLCKHYRGNVCCDAFPDRIPRELIYIDNHDTPFPGDNGIRFEPKEQAD